MKATITWDVSPTAWTAFLERTPNATFFHSAGWYATHAAVAAYRPRAVHLQFEDGAEALLPLAVSRRYRGLVQVAQAGIESGYGGLVSPAPLTDAHVRAAYRLVRDRYPDLEVAGSPFSADEGALVGGEASPSGTQIVPVMAPDAQMRAMNAKRAARVRKSAKVGFELTVVEAPTEARVADFYALYAAHASYWQYAKWVRDEAYFRALLRHAGEHLTLFLVHLDGELAGFRLLARQGDHALGLHLATTRTHEKLDVGPFMIGATLNWCHAHGCRTFDFLPSGPLDGVQAYKASYGAEAMPFWSASATSLTGRGLSAAWGWMRRARPAPLAPAAGA
ncbi:MAG: GNAT family N-acetyltransferase [Candidatus Sericytochromatia bacterium]